MDARGRPDELMGGAAMGEAVQVGDALVDQAGATEPRARICGKIRAAPNGT